MRALLVTFLVACNSTPRATVDASAQPPVSDATVHATEDGGDGWARFWISTSGDDAKDCRTRETACSTWKGLLGRARPSFGALPVDLVLDCGSYDVAATGPFKQDAPIVGAPGAPVRVRASTARCATLRGDGRAILSFDRAQWLTVSGLRVEQRDRCFSPTTCKGGPNAGRACAAHADCPSSACLCACTGDDCGGSDVIFTRSVHVEVSDCEIVKDNRYYNVEPLGFFSCDFVLAAKNRIYGAHRHMITNLQSARRCDGLMNAPLCMDASDCTSGNCLEVASDGTPHSVITLNYLNACAGGPSGEPDCAAWAADMPVGWPSNLPQMGDECISTYYSNDSRVINNIAEDCDNIGANIGYGGGSGNLFANNVLVHYFSGFGTSANTGTGGPMGLRTEHNTGVGDRFVNNVAIASAGYGSVLRDGSGTVFANNTIVRSHEHDPGGLDPKATDGLAPGLYASRTSGVSDGSDPCATPPTSIEVSRNFIAAVSAPSAWRYGYALSETCSVTGSHNAYCEALGACGSGDIGIFVGDATLTLTSSRRDVDPGAGLAQFVFIPKGDPREHAANGAPIGADIRCVIDEQGAPTSVNMWTAGFADDPRGVVTRLLGGQAAPTCP